MPPLPVKVIDKYYSYVWLAGDLRGKLIANKTKINDGTNDFTILSLSYLDRGGTRIRMDGKGHNFVKNKMYNTFV